MINTISGGITKDNRGQIRFVNDFDMTLVKRFYMIKNVNTQFMRGWRAHKIEQRWFYVLSGEFELNQVKIDNWESPSRDLPVERKILKVDDYQLIHIPVGYGIALRALEEGSELLVFADYGIEHAPQDDYSWPADYFTQP